MNLSDLLSVWNKVFPSFNGSLEIPVNLCGLPETISVSENEISGVYFSLCKHFANTLEKSGLPRILVGVSGPAGSGKTTLASLLATLCNAAPGYLPPAVSVSMDAYHQTNAWLKREGLAPFKGRHDTYHVIAFANDLALLASPKVTPLQPPTAELPLESRSGWAEARTCGDGLEVLLPVYDRAVTHDPVLGGVRVFPDVGIVFVEGLFLARNSGSWVNVFKQLTGGCIAIDTPLSVCRSRALHRRMRSILISRSKDCNGSSEVLFRDPDTDTLEKLKEAENHYVRADLVTYGEIKKDTVNATVVLEFELSQRASRELGVSVDETLALPALEVINALEGITRSGEGLGKLSIRRGL